MFNINQLLERMRVIRNSDIGLRVAVQTALKKISSFDVPVEAIQIKSGKVFLKNIPTAARSDIFIKKSRILEEIKNTIGSEKIKEIA